jgi:rod shape-determining protein MreD
MVLKPLLAADPAAAPAGRRTAAAEPARRQGAQAMIMRPGQPLLLPANPFFIWFSLIFAMMLNMLPVGRLPWMPDLLARGDGVLERAPAAAHRCGRAFLFGLAMDVHQASLLGQHALAYTTLSYFAITIHRRLLWFKVPSQARAGAAAVRRRACDRAGDPHAGGGAYPGPTLLLAPVLEAALWPWSASCC